MLRQIFVKITRFVKKIESMAETIPAALKQSQEADDGEPAQKKAKVEGAAPMTGRLDRKRKVALLVAYCGAGYYGIQRNPGFPTIEEELIQALVKAELIPQEHADTPHKMSFQRASRTDKGVSAAGNVISLKDNIPEEINKHLPPQIRVFAYTRGTRGFDGQHHCSHRTYTYMLPTYSFAPFEKFITEDYRVDGMYYRDYATNEDRLKQVGEILAMFQGTHNFHNYTSGVKPNDPSAKRYIIRFECSKPFVRDGIEFSSLSDCSKPFVRDGIEFSSLTVKGQSFMLHHIRKMIGLTTAIVRGYCGKEVIEKSWQPTRLDIPKAPGLGLYLERLHFDGYNKKFGVDGLHEPMDWENLKDEIDKFKEEYIIKHIVRSEKEEKVMFRWLGTLQYHKFDVELDEDQKAWFEMRSFLRKTERAKEAEKAEGKTKSDSPPTDSNVETPESKEVNLDSSDISEIKKAESTTDESSATQDKAVNNSSEITARLTATAVPPEVSKDTSAESDRDLSSVGKDSDVSGHQPSEEQVSEEKDVQSSDHLTQDKQGKTTSIVGEQRAKIKS